MTIKSHKPDFVKYMDGYFLIKEPLLLDLLQSDDLQEEQRYAPVVINFTSCVNI